MLKKFIRYYKPHMPLFLLDFCCAFLMAGIDLIYPMVANTVIDKILPQKNLKLLILTGVGMVILYVIRSVFQYIVNYWGHVLGVRMEYDMRKDLFHHVQKLSFHYFDNTKTGQIMSRLVNDLNQISELAHHGPEDLFIAIVKILGAFVIMATIEWKLTSILVCIVIIMFVFTLSKNRKMHAAFKDMRKKVGDINAQIEDSISGIRVVKAFANEPYEAEKFDIRNKNFRVSKERSLKVMSEFLVGMTLFSKFISLAVLIFGGVFIYYGQLTEGQLVGFLLYVSMFLQPIRRIMTLIENYQKGMAGFERFIETLEIDPEIVDDKDAKVLDQVAGDVLLDQVTFSYGNDQKILKDINLHIKPGQTLALVGPSGAGKTTICSLIPRFYEVDSGKIMIDHVDIKNITQKSLREHIGIVQQDVFIFSESIKKNIAYGKKDVTDEEIIYAAKCANAHEFIMNLENGYDTHVGERGVKLSGGQKQRIAIARIFLKNPPILILDEATSALDNETEKMIQKSLNDLSKNRTTLVIAHRLGTIIGADEIIVLTDEGVAEKGTHKELLEQDGVYRKLYESQFQK